MFKMLRCLRKGHLYVDSRRMPGTTVCVRCRHRTPFEGLVTAPSGGRVALRRGEPAAEPWRRVPWPEQSQTKSIQP
jgi:hypothetical protein